MRCEGWERKGGIFTLGPVKWEQCKNEAVVMIEIKREGEDTQKLPACHECWQKLIDGKDQDGAKIVSVEPIMGGD